MSLQRSAYVNTACAAWHQCACPVHDNCSCPQPPKQSCSTACTCCRCGAAHWKVVHCCVRPAEAVGYNSRVQSAETASAGADWRAHRNSETPVYSLKICAFGAVEAIRRLTASQRAKLCAESARVATSTHSRAGRTCISSCVIVAPVYSPLHRYNKQRTGANLTILVQAAGLGEIMTRGCFRCWARLSTVV